MLILESRQEVVKNIEESNPLSRAKSLEDGVLLLVRTRSGGSRYVVVKAKSRDERWRIGTKGFEGRPGGRPLFMRFEDAGTEFLRGDAPHAAACIFGESGRVCRPAMWRHP